MTDAYYQSIGADDGDVDLAELFRAVEAVVAGKPVPEVVAVAAILIGNCIMMQATDRTNAHRGADAVAVDIKEYIDACMGAASLAAAEPAGYA